MPLDENAKMLYAKVKEIKLWQQKEFMENMHQ